MAIIGTQKFSVDAGSKVFAACATDLYQSGYRDAAETIMLRSQNTGVHSLFNRARTLIDDERGEIELMGWEYRPSDEVVRDVPALRGWTIVVFND